MPDIHTPLDALRDCLPGLAEPPQRLRAGFPPLRRRTLAAGQLLFTQGQAAGVFYLLESGRLRLEMGHPGGASALLSEVRGPTVLGLAAFATGRASSYEARALGTCRVWAIGPAPYAMLMDEWPGFARALLRRFAEHFDGNLRLLNTARHAPAAERLEAALRAVALEQRAMCQADGWQRVRTTQAELAQRAGVSRQGANAWLRALQRRGGVQIGYGWLMFCLRR